MDFSEHTQRRVRSMLVGACRAVADARRPFAPPELTALVAPVPLSWEDARRMVRPSDISDVPEDAEIHLERRVWREPVIAALASKAAATHSAVWALADAGFGCDAFALLRDLLENLIILSWLLTRDHERRKERIDTFILHYETVCVRMAELDELDAREHGGSRRTPGVDARTRAISSEVFDDRWMYWAYTRSPQTGRRELVRLRSMAEEVGLGPIYARDYFQMSSFTHSSPGSVFTHSTAPFETLRTRATFQLDQDLFRAPVWAEKAAILANNFLLLVLRTLDSEFQLGLKGRLDDIQAAIEGPSAGLGEPPS